jgi:hypothetical protein
MNKQLSQLNEQEKNHLNHFLNTPLVYGGIREISPRLKEKRKIKYPYDDVILILQFFIPDDEKRYSEIKKALEKNCLNKKIQKIYLLNERIYLDEELGTNSKKIKQIDIKTRLTFKNVFDFIESEKLNGCIIFCNSDIFFNDSLEFLPKFNLCDSKDFISLLRYEYKNESNLNKCKIFGPRWDSQDSWIIHSNQNVEKKYREAFNFNFGQPGCDNKLYYLMKVLGYKVYNDPSKIKSFHIHEQQTRSYNQPALRPPYLYSIPPDVGFENFNLHYDYNFMKQFCFNFQKFNFNTDHNVFKTFLSHYFNNNKLVAIPLIDNVKINGEFNTEAFSYCDAYFNWENYGTEFKIVNEHMTKIDKNFPQKFTFWSKLNEIFHYIFKNPWTQLLKGKKILLVSDHIDKIKLNVKSPVYPVDLYPDCKFKYLDVKNNSIENLQENLKTYVNKFKDMKDGYDIVLLNAGPYNNYLLSELYKLGKDSIVVGNLLKLHFGCYLSDEEIKYKDVFNIYKNKHWTKLD